MSDAQPQPAGPGAVPTSGSAPANGPPAVAAPASASPGTPALGSAMVADQLAIDIGRAVLAVLQRSLQDGRLPPELAKIANRPGHDGLFSALERARAPDHGEDNSGPHGILGPASGSGANPPPVARPQAKKRPGTVTIRAAVRRAQELAMAPPGSDLAHLRLAFLAVLITVVLVAVAVTYVLSFVKW